MRVEILGREVFEGVAPLIIAAFQECRDEINAIDRTPEQGAGGHLQGLRDALAITLWETLQSQIVSIMLDYIKANPMRVFISLGNHGDSTEPERWEYKPPHANARLKRGTVCLAPYPGWSGGESAAVSIFASKAEWDDFISDVSREMAAQQATPAADSDGDAKEQGDG